ncbi:MAG: hypothetical protein H0X66_12140 [Verrucomicrobia bacterium]|nr:hypothetical protein [Verrucomicrobiota bacterium]
MAFSMQGQQQTNWCWAACAASIKLFYTPSSNWTQCLLANSAFSRTDCCTNPVPSACNIGWTFKQALQLTGNFDHQITQKAALVAIRRDVDKCRPIAASIFWHGGGGHGVVIYGVEDHILGAKIYVADPFFGNSLMRYSSFPANYQTGADWTITDFTKP